MAAVIAVLFFVFIIGLCIGSFLNVVILRALSNESIVFPSSKCPSCQTSLKWWHNIPVLSYICLRGKCAFCKEKISIQYPVIELLTGIIFVMVVIKFGINLDALFAMIVSSLFIVMAVTDIKEKVVFDAHTYTLVGVGLLYALIVAIVQFIGMHQLTGSINLTPEWWINNPLTTSILGIVAGIVIMECAARLGYLLAGTRAFGEGDTYIAAGIGAMFGWHTLLWILLYSLVIQVIFTLPVFIKKLICTNDWKTLISLSAFAVYAITFMLCEKAGLLASTIIYAAGALLLAVIGLYVCRQILKGLKNNPDGMTYLPFGPAMVIAGFLVLLI